MINHRKIQYMVAISCNEMFFFIVKANTIHVHSGYIDSLKTYISMIFLLYAAFKFKSTVSIYHFKIMPALFSGILHNLKILIIGKFITTYNLIFWFMTKINGSPLCNSACVTPIKLLLKLFPFWHILEYNILTSFTHLLIFLSYPVIFLIIGAMTHRIHIAPK